MLAFSSLALPLPWRRNRKGVLPEVQYTGGKNSGEHAEGLESFCRVGKYNAPFGLLITQQESGPVGDNVLAVPAYALLSVL